MSLLMAGWEMFIISAARLTVPYSITALNAST